jgi:hypothetical protein
MPSDGVMPNCTLGPFGAMLEGKAFPHPPPADATGAAYFGFGGTYLTRAALVAPEVVNPANEVLR